MGFSQILVARVTDYGWLNILPPLRDLLDEAVQDLQNDINQEQPIRNSKRFIEGSAHSTLLASKGLGADYNNPANNILIGLGAGVAWDAETDVALNDEISGVAGASSFVVGTRLHHLGWTKVLGQKAEKFTGYINFGSFSQPYTIPAGDIKILSDISGMNVGVHIRYDWINGQGDDWWGWGGIKITAGYEYSKKKIGLNTKLNEEFELDTGQGIIRNQILGSPHYEIATSIHSFPVEISTYVRFLKLFTLYGGLAADYNSGLSKGTGEVMGEATPLICVNGLCSTLDALPEVEIKGNLDADVIIRSLSFRYFGGLQINLPHHLHAYGQVQRLIGTEVIGVGVGIKYSH